MNGLFSRGETARIAFTYGLLVLETLCNLALPALVGLAIDGIIRRDFTELYLLVAGIVALIVSGSFRKVYDTRNFGHIQTRLALSIGAQEIPATRKIARVRLIDDLGQFFDTYLPQAIGGFISTIGAVAVLFFYDWKVAAASVATVAAILLFTALVSRRTSTINFRINRRMESEASILQSRQPHALLRHMDVLRRLRNHRSDAETVMFVGGWIIITGLIVFSIILSARSGATAGHIFAILSYVLAVAEGFSVLPPMIERLTRTRDVIRRIQNE
jgi:ABC-type transport system involved in cytochrome bd biosynthesis fused ATPase/permease subunit